ncbi:MAG: type II toxin-antitoxin system RelE/ParE family toxin [Acidimicrobiales bacterium]
MTSGGSLRTPGVRPGYQLDRVQHGLDPDDWKPISSIGSGSREIRVRDKDGTLRVFYVATIDERCMCCTPFRRRPRRPRKRIWTWPRSDTERLGTNDDR